VSTSVTVAPSGLLVRSAAGLPVAVEPGPALLVGTADGPSLAAHRNRYGTAPSLTIEALLGLTSTADVRGRGGAGFPFARKLRTAASRRRTPVVVVNAAEGEPGSHKDAALLQVAPHLVLDGAAVTAAALGTREVHIVVRGGAPHLVAAVLDALDERVEPVRWSVHTTGDSFLSGQSTAVLELLAGRTGLPVTSTRPSAEAGHRSRPTVLSNAETFAHVARLALLGRGEAFAHGTPEQPGTTLLSVGDLHGALDPTARTPRPPTVREVEHGTPWAAVLTDVELAAPVLLGGLAGTWAAPGSLAELPVSPGVLGDHGLALGAGVVSVLPDGCPVVATTAVVAELARHAAGRCGPCRNGLPALAGSLAALQDGLGGWAEVARYAGLVDGRGACAHPDGTVRVVRSLLTAYADEVEAHVRGRCAMPVRPGAVG
jgi:NADH:ubiquinone oxidoreductase subunit F (NADH-binding)